MKNTIIESIEKELLLLMKLEETKEILENEKYEYIQTD